MKMTNDQMTTLTTFDHLQKTIKIRGKSLVI